MNHIFHHSRESGNPTTNLDSSFLSDLFTVAAYAKMLDAPFRGNYRRERIY